MKITGAEWAGFMEWLNPSYALDDVVLVIDGQEMGDEHQDDDEMFAKAPAAKEVEIVSGRVHMDQRVRPYFQLLTQHVSLYLQERFKPFGGAKTIGELVELLNKGLRLTVEFTAAIEEGEGYLEGGMRGELRGPVQDHGDYVVIPADLNAFDAHNRTLERANFNNPKGGDPVTAREAGFYPKGGVEDVYADHDRSVLDLFAPVSEARSLLMAEFANSSETNYVRWLESQVMGPAAASENHIDGFIASVMSQARGFREHWMAEHLKNAEKYPLELPHDNSGLWWEMLQSFDPDEKAGEE